MIAKTNFIEELNHAKYLYFDVKRLVIQPTCSHAFQLKLTKYQIVAEKVFFMKNRQTITFQAEIHQLKATSVISRFFPLAGKLKQYSLHQCFIRFLILIDENPGFLLLYSGHTGLDPSFTPLPLHYTHLTYNSSKKI